MFEKLNETGFNFEITKKKKTVNVTDRESITMCALFFFGLIIGGLHNLKDMSVPRKSWFN